jgi:hypothetical protein
MKRSVLKKIIKELIQEEIERDGLGRVSDANINYSEVRTNGDITKVIAILKGKKSEQFTKAINDLIELQSLEELIEKKKEELKQSRVRDEVADLFGAQLTLSTRVIKTVSAYELVLSKDPKATDTVKWSEVYKELSVKLTPELITVAEALVKKFTTTTQKPASVSIKKIDESQIGGIFKSFLEKIRNWGKSYDKKLGTTLNKIKSL